MSQTHTSSSATDNEEHRSVNGVNVKAVAPYVLDTVTGGLVPQSGGSVPYAYDYIAYANTSGTVDTWTFKSGGSGGTLVATVTITYVDTTKSQISTVART